MEKGSESLGAAAAPVPTSQEAPEAPFWERFSTARVAFAARIETCSLSELPGHVCGARCGTGPVPLRELLKEIGERKKELREMEKQRWALRKQPVVVQLTELSTIIRRERAFLKDLARAASQYDLKFS